MFNKDTTFTPSQVLLLCNRSPETPDGERLKPGWFIRAGLRNVLFYRAKPEQELLAPIHPNSQGGHPFDSLDAQGEVKRSTALQLLDLARNGNKVFLDIPIPWDSKANGDTRYLRLL